MIANGMFAGTDGLSGIVHDLLQKCHIIAGSVAGNGGYIPGQMHRCKGIFTLSDGRGNGIVIGYMR